MTEKTEKTKKAFIISGFKDAGSERRFTAGDVLELPEGAFANFAFAGLVREPTAEETRASKAAA